MPCVVVDYFKLKSVRDLSTLRRVNEAGEIRFSTVGVL